MTTTVTQRPDTFGQSSGITLFGGAGNLWTTLGDNTNTTYAQTTPGGFGKILFDPFTVPSGAVVQWIVFRATGRRVADGTVCYCSLNGHTPVQFRFPTGSGWATLSSISFASVLSNADLADGVALVWAVGPGNADLSEVFLDITYIPIPTVNVTAPTGTIGVSRPKVRWDMTGDYPQERFRVKVFSSAQYGGAGFNVDNSTALYDSGEQVGSKDVFTPTLNLPDADTYRFYVKVAQRVGSTTQWSAWDFSTTTVAVTPAAVPTLTVTAQPVDARIQIVATISGSPTWQFVNIERLRDGAWVPVRNADRALVTGTTFTVYDYESGNGELVQYRAQSVIEDPAGDIASAWSAPTSSVSWSSTLTVLKSLTQPILNRAIYIESLPVLKRRIPRGVIDVAGRSDPVVVSDVRKSPEGTVTFITLTDDDRDDLINLLNTGETLLLQTPEEDGFGSRYISCGDADENRVSRRSQETSRTFTVPFNEVAAPVGQILTFGSAWDDLIANTATWTATIAAYPTWNAVIAARF